MQPSRGEIRRDLLVIALATVSLFGVALGARDLWNPNEPVYGQAVAEMAARGDWGVPTVNGVVFAEKPILYYWLALGFSRVLGGVSELALRLPSALAGVVGALLLYLLVLPYASRARARLAVALYATTFMVFWGSRTIQMDVLVMVTTLGVVLAATRVLDHRLPPWAGWTLAGIAAGVGFLSKALVGLVVPTIIVVAYAVVTRRGRSLVTPSAFLGIAALAAVAAPWILWLAATGQTDFLVELLYRQHFARFVDPWDHARPWWYFLKYFWIDMAPWSWFVPLAAALPRRDNDEHSLDLLAWLWILGPILFFSLSASKRSAYILPVAPAAAILVSGLAERFADGRLGRGRRRACAAVMGLFGVVTIGAGIALVVEVIPDYPDAAAEGRAVALLLVAGGASVLAGVTFLRRSRLAAPTAMLSLVVVLYLLVSVSALPAADAYKSARPFCERVASVVAPEEPLASYRFWVWRASYPFYLKRQIPNLQTVDELRDYWIRDERVFLILHDARLEETRSVLGESQPLAQARIGSRTAYLFSNH
jgi:4-amino-4-deoxy-L-arabinose transferase-like glycosyltransferase